VRKFEFEVMSHDNKGRSNNSRGGPQGRERQKGTLLILPLLASAWVISGEGGGSGAWRGRALGSKKAAKIPNVGMTCYKKNLNRGTLEKIQGTRIVTTFDSHRPFGRRR